ncbi:DEAD/DEAH box helicase [Cupriavidus metallidurans]|uniref:DEAD/DEAH box helicase n=1 Tax=Cupriavidus metallidurans TaxID=119219 RepID=UPI00055A7E53|nr:DEAD/DEAH box helicase [Cupriavidus metallidurans]
MRANLQNWINDADSVRHLRFFSIAQTPIHLARITNRPEDYYISLVGELFRSMETPDTSRDDWAQLGNAFLQFSVETSDEQLRQHGIAREEATLYAAASFYFGDYPASACLAMRRGGRPPENQSLQAACFDFLARPPVLESAFALAVRESLRIGDMQRLARMTEATRLAERRALQEGPGPWIAAKLLHRLLNSFNRSHVRAVLPDGHLEFWHPLVASLLDRQPSTWEFFPSQIDAIRGGLLASMDSYSLQMPTGAGKTTLCETLLYWHLKRAPQDVAILLVPYRSLASELRGTLVRRLNAVGIAARCAYGGTVPSGEEIHALADVQAVVATPEALSGLLGADPDFAGRIGLVICDEGHLLDGGERGIGLELLLARLKARQARQTRFVFMSAIVPNIEQINGWLGGTNQTVVRSSYRPASAEFAVLRPAGDGVRMEISLEMHPHEAQERRFSIDGFLARRDFSYPNPETGRLKTHPFTPIKTQAIATARKVLPMGATAIFAANKRGAQGAIGIAETLVEQLQIPLPLPRPIDFARLDTVQKSVAYLELEYGIDWVGTAALRNGVALHHGDIPQETREVLEGLVRALDVKLVICTSTLAEGVNLPIRTLVLYSVQRRGTTGQEAMLARDIKNLVGRAGRAGANTKGLVICANPDQWQFVEPVARQGAGEAVEGSLRKLVEAITRFLTRGNLPLTNEFLEANPPIYPLIDGVDATLIELLSDEIGEAQFVAMAQDLAAQTFAAQQLSAASTAHLRTVFALRAGWLFALRGEGKIGWARTTGARARWIDSVELGLLPRRPDWSVAADPLSDEVRLPLFEWAWTLPELRQAVKRSFRLDENEDVNTVKERFFEIATLWMRGSQYREIADRVGMPMDDLLGVCTQGISFSLQTIVEQGVSLLEKKLERDGNVLAEGVQTFPEHLRFGVPNAAARLLAASGLRHRRACIQLGVALQAQPVVNHTEVKTDALASLRAHADAWRAHLGELVYQNTLSDLSSP